MPCGAPAHRPCGRPAREHRRQPRQRLAQALRMATVAGSGSKTSDAGLHLGRVNAPACRQSPCAWRAPRPMPVVRGLRVFHGHAVHDPRQCRRGARPGPGPCAWAAALPHSSPQAMPCIDLEVQMAEGQPHHLRSCGQGSRSVQSGHAPDQGSKPPAAPQSGPPHAGSGHARPWRPRRRPRPSPPAGASALQVLGMSRVPSALMRTRQACAACLPALPLPGPAPARALLVGRCHGHSSQSAITHVGTRCPWSFQGVRGAWQERKERRWPVAP